MTGEVLGKTLAQMIQELLKVEEMAHNVSGRFENSCREVEFLKIEIIGRELERRRKSSARQLGFPSIAKDKAKLRIGLGVAVAGLVLGAAFTRDKSVALHTGISSFEGALEGFGKCQWAVSLDKYLVVIPRDKIFSGRVWVTWESLRSTLEELKQDTVAGEKLGNLDSVIAKLRQRKHSLVHLFIPVVETSESHWRRVSN